MLYRNKKKEDPNAGKWIGIGGHQEEGESPLDCVRREFLEETSLRVKDLRLAGLIQFLFEEYEDELTFCYTADGFEGELNDSCSEGDLAWIPEEEILSLSLWEGDRLFLPRLRENAPLFSLKLVYDARGALIASVWEDI